MPDIEKTTADNIDVFFGKINEAADIVSAKLVDVAPEAADALLTLVQYKGVFTLSTYAIGTIIALIVSYKFGLISLAHAKRTDWSDFPIPILGGGVVSAIGAVVCLVNFSYLFDFFYWVSAFYPEGAIAMKALEAVGVNL